MSYAGVPGMVETTEDHGQLILAVDPARIAEACVHLRDEHGFNFLSDVSATDYLGWGKLDVAGYIGTADGRDINEPGSQGYARTPAPKPTRFCVSYQLLRVSDDPARLRLQVWIDDGEPLDSVISVWPAADWLEREIWDMMGIRFTGHPNLVRILMADDWDGHPLRKDYPLGGEPVRFSEAE